jgi:hypothetical protein
MSTYTPDTWVVLEFDYDGDVIRKVFAGWYGGFANGDAWKLSSGITETKDFEDRYEFLNESGSLYICHKNAYGMGGYQSSIYSTWVDVIAKTDTTTMKLIEEYNV